jgi:hAT family C-terminal dimerisation region
VKTFFVWCYHQKNVTGCPLRGYEICEYDHHRIYIHHIIKTFTNLFLEMLTKYGITYDADLHRLRCMGHIINLSVNSFLWVTDTEDLEQPNNQTLNEDLAAVKEWRKKGPLGKLHNAVVHAQCSPQRLQDFIKLSHGRHPVRDNKTRWNSWATMLTANTKPQLLEAFKAYISNYPDLQEDSLSNEDWEALRNIRDFLNYLKGITLELEGHSATLKGTLPAMDLILKAYEDRKIEFEGDKVMEAMVNAGWRKMDKYYRLTDKTPAYVAAVVLNPSLKWDYINAEWLVSEVTDAKKAMKEFWEDHYKPTGITPNQETQPNTTSTPAGSLAAHLRRHQAARAIPTNEYEHYIQQEPEYNVEDPLKWWLEETQRMKYPNLSQMAIDILTIPAMSDEPERVFSGAKLTLNQQRNKLGVDLLRAFECLKSWYKLKSFDGGNALENFMAGLMDSEAFQANLDDLNAQTG